jgi:hypothetical protein
LLRTRRSRTESCSCWFSCSTWRTSARERSISSTLRRTGLESTAPRWCVAPAARAGLDSSCACSAIRVSDRSSCDSTCCAMAASAPPPPPAGPAAAVEPPAARSRTFSERSACISFSHTLTPWTRRCRLCSTSPPPPPPPPPAAACTAAAVAAAPSATAPPGFPLLRMASTRALSRRVAAARSAAAACIFSARRQPCANWHLRPYRQR